MPLEILKYILYYIDNIYFYKIFNYDPEDYIFVIYNDKNV